MNAFPICFAIGLIAPVIHLLFLKPEKRAARDIVDLVLLYQLIFAVGFGGLLGAYAHLFMSDETAKYIGWPTGSPFQYEVGYANLTFGILGLLCFFIRGHFWTATVLGISIWYLLDAYGHVRDYLFHHNTAPGNTGLPLFIDIAIPIFLLALLALHLSLKPSR